MDSPVLLNTFLRCLRSVMDLSHKPLSADSDVISYPYVGRPRKRQRRRRRRRRRARPTPPSTDCGRINQRALPSSDSGLAKRRQRAHRADDRWTTRPRSLSLLFVRRRGGGVLVAVYLHVCARACGTWCAGGAMRVCLCYCKQRRG